jgi:hypothetical protein
MQTRRKRRILYSRDFWDFYCTPDPWSFYFLDLCFFFEGAYDISKSLLDVWQLEPVGSGSVFLTASVHSRSKMYGTRAIREILFAFCWENTRKYGKNEGKLWMYTLLRISIRNTGPDLKIFTHRTRSRKF